MQLAKFSFVHLVAGSWYLDYSCGFVPKLEEALYNNIVSSAPEVNKLKEEPEENNLALPSNEKEVAPVKGKGKGKKVAAHASSQVSIRSFMKTTVQRTTAPTTTVVGSPTTTHSAASSNPITATFQSGATIPLVPCKRKAIASNTSVTFFKRSSTLSLIENVDIRELIEDLMKTKVPFPAYHRM